MGALKSALLIFLSMWTVFAAAQDPVPIFLQKHWAFPIPEQGSAPKFYTPLERSLQPQSCGICHTDQYRAWKGSRHALAMGPGVIGQLLEMKSMAEVRACTRCHAPLAEQEKSLLLHRNGDLHERGLICADCHVRRNIRYGPPSIGKNAARAHGGFVASDAFLDGRFCATCHQFGKDGYALQGKMLENTYNEWLQSSYAKQGIQCQGCHMPGREHLWKGIHDPEMSRKALSIERSAPELRHGILIASLAVKNSGAGHDFPTYVTPRVLVQIWQESGDEKPIRGTLRERIIERDVSPDLSAEISDTRLSPGKGMILDYRVPSDKMARYLVMRIRVEPDHYYAGLYRSLLSSLMKPESKALIGAALKNAENSAYDLHFERFPLRPSDKGTA